MTSVDTGRRGRSEPDPERDPQQHGAFTDAAGSIDDGAPTWAAFRRLHFYINDLIVRDLDRIGINVLDRRILDALNYAEVRGADEGLPVATICDLIPVSTKPQTVGSALERMLEPEWVEQSGESLGPRRGRRWRLTETGHGVRDDYIRITEMILREIYCSATEEQRRTLREHGGAAVRFMDAQLGPVVDSHRLEYAGQARLRMNWAALRHAHFFINDLFFERAQRLGVDIVERRILDSMGFAERRGVVGIGVSTLCALIPPPTRHQTAASVLRRMERSGWVATVADDDGDGAERARLWHLTVNGQRVRAAYKRFAEQQIQTVYGELANHRQLLELAESAEAHRNARLEPVLKFAR